MTTVNRPMSPFEWLLLMGLALIGRGLAAIDGRLLHRTCSGARVGLVLRELR